MSTPDQPESTPLTRRRLREIRATGATPIITPADAEVDADARESSAPEPVAPAAPTPLPRAAAPAPVPPAPLPDAAVDLGVSPLTRRQARTQERIRTASVPVIQVDAIPLQAATVVPPATQPATAPDPADEDDRPEEAEAAAAPVSAVATAAVTDDEPAQELAKPEPAAASEVQTAVESDDAVESDEEDAPVSSVVNPALGSGLLAGDQPAVSIPPSFDQLIARSGSGSGSTSTPNALILSQTPTATPLAPISSTGEVLITGSFDLPAGLGSNGHAHGTTDGKDVDATLIDGELPASSSPTPIAASAAISTARHSGEEIIRPPAPEKGNKLMLALVVTAGVLALALVGVLILAVTTGVF
ncbi:hypothetical protein E4V99_13645 [Microbacterium sp. dk485]|uniref:hypothetical protein n=1 Tax=Microbacterium sp. dk485 TaxID=2560021 RepID=UPI00107450C0|nr:hypothetical protein [Microbacterium sp. dk485]TFV81981.1 hypothetical protein E4V99_13645 [Microbacterium sp. dk485]